MSDNSIQDNKLFDTFIQDSSTIIGNLNKILIELEINPGQKDLVHTAFREIHSLKSEAAYLHLDGIAKQAHDFETKLAAIRDGKTTVTPDLLNTFFSAIDTLQENLQQALREGARRGDDSGTPSKKRPSIESTEEAGKDREQLFFSDFEKTLLREAQQRGERFYRVVCELEEELPMKFPRVFLLINNLELLVNVIKVVPQPDELEKNETELTIFFTATIEEKEIYEALNVDEVKRVQIAALEYESYIITGIEEDITVHTEQSVREPNYLRIETAKIDDLVTYIGELQLRIDRLGEKPVNEKEVSKVHALTADLRRILRTIRLVPFESEAGRLRRFVRDFSKTCEKNIRFSLIGGSIEVDRALLELIMELLIHLIRNGIDHGIEGPEERLERGKDETGNIVVAAVQTEAKLSFQVIDDGKGIEKKQIIDAVSGIDRKPATGDLFSILSKPGFSTREQVTDYSGRGVGLDIVSKKVAGIEKARVRMVTRPGEGSVFTLEFPGGFALKRLVLVRAGERTVAVPKRNVASVAIIEKTNYSRDDEGSLLYDGLPVFTLKGRLHYRENHPSEPYGLHIQHLEHRGCLLADEVLFEKEVPESQFKLLEEVEPHLYKVSLGDSIQDFLYFHPSYINGIEVRSPLW